MSHTIYGTKTGMVKGVLFDMDGVILDTEKLYARFWMEACHALGYPMTYEQALGMRSLSARAGQARLESYFGPGISREAVRNKRVELMDAYTAVHGVEPKAGVYELLAFLKAQGIPAAITTSSPIQRVQRYLEPLELYDAFDRICTGYDVARGKPEPDIYLYGAECLGLRPEQCLAIEDSPAGIESAWRAGCMAVLVPDLEGSNEPMRKMLFAEADSLADVVQLIQNNVAGADCKFANALLDTLPNQHYSPVVLIGNPQTVNKMLQSFLCRMEAEGTRVLICTQENADAVRKAENSVLLFENIQTYAEVFSAQKTFIDVFDTSKEKHNVILVTSDRDIHSLNVEERMKARLHSGVAAQIDN